MSIGEGRERPGQYTHWEEQVKGSCDPVRVLMRGLGLNREIVDKKQEVCIIKCS